MKRVAPIALIAVLVATSATRPGAAGAQRDAALPVAIPFELAARHIIVKISVNKSRPLSFVLDTGAGPAIIRMEAAKELGLSLRGTVNALGAGPGVQVGSLVEGARWSFPGLDSFTQPVPVALPLPTLPSALGRDIDGIVGGDFIRHFVVELDYQTRTMTLHDRATFAYSGPGETLPIELNANGHPVLRATITPVDGKPIERSFLLDIGSALALALHSPFVAEQNLVEPGLKTIPAIGASGAGGQSIGRLGRVAALRIGSFTIDRPIALFSQDKAGAFADASLAGNIGAQIASRFHMWLDYERRRIILEPGPGVAAPFDRSFVGISLRAEGRDYRTFRVHEVLDDSPAREAGLVEGDVILAVNGTPAADLTLSMITDMFEQPVAYELTIRRGERTLKATLTPRTLI